MPIGAFFLGLWLADVVIGLILIGWAKQHLPTNIAMHSAPIRTRVTTGPYRWLRHPMYLGEILLFTGLGGLSAGPLNALAFFLLTVTLCGEWASREEFHVEHDDVSQR